MDLLSERLRERIPARLGDRGKRWLEQLPSQARQIAAAHHAVITGPALPAGSMSAALPVRLADGRRAVLKFPAPDADSHETHALLAWAEAPHVASLIDHGDGWLMTGWLEGRRPELGELPTGALTELLNELRATYTAPRSVEPLERRMALRFTRENRSTELDRLARTRVQALFDQPVRPALLHGDLANKNLLWDDRHLSTIDPLGLWGDPAYDAAFLANLHDPVQCEQRLEDLADQLSYDHRRVRWWAGSLCVQHLASSSDVMRRRYAPLEADGTIARLLS